MSPSLPHLLSCLISLCCSQGQPLWRPFLRSSGLPLPQASSLPPSLHAKCLPWLSSPWVPSPLLLSGSLPSPGAAVTHSATSFNLGPLQSDGDTVEEDEGQDYVVKKLVSNDGLTQDPEPEWKSRNPQEGQLASHSDQKEDKTTIHTRGPEWLKGRGSLPSCSHPTSA